MLVGCCRVSCWLCLCRAAAAVVRLLLSCALLVVLVSCWLCPVGCVGVLFASCLRPVGCVLLVGCCRAAAAVVRLLFGCLYVFFWGKGFLI